MRTYIFKHYNYLFQDTPLLCGFTMFMLDVVVCYTIDSVTSIQSSSMTEEIDLNPVRKFLQENDFLNCMSFKKSSEPQKCHFQSIHPDTKTPRMP